MVFNQNLTLNLGQIKNYLNVSITVCKIFNIFFVHLNLNFKSISLTQMRVLTFLVVCGAACGACGAVSTPAKAAPALGCATATGTATGSHRHRFLHGRPRQGKHVRSVITGGKETACFDVTFLSLSFSATVSSFEFTKQSRYRLNMILLRL